MALLGIVVRGLATVSPSGVLLIVYFGDVPVLSEELTPEGAGALLDVALPLCESVVTPNGEE